METGFLQHKFFICDDIYGNRYLGILGNSLFKGNSSGICKFVMFGTGALPPIGNIFLFRHFWSVQSVLFPVYKVRTRTEHIFCFKNASIKYLKILQNGKIILISN